MKLIIRMIDRDGDETEAFLDSSARPPVLRDWFGQPLLDMDTHPFYPQRYKPPDPSAPPVKAFLDAFMMKPSPGLDMKWLANGEAQGDPDWMGKFAWFAEAIATLTGKRLVAVSVDGK